MAESVVSNISMPSAVKRKIARRLREETSAPPRPRALRCVVPAPPSPRDGLAQSVVDFHPVIRKAILIDPVGRGSIETQIREVLLLLEDAIATGRSKAMTVATLTVFLRDEKHRDACKSRFLAHFAGRLPVTNYVLQAPCSGAALAVEAWAWGGSGADVEWHGPHALTVSHDGLRWIHCGGIEVLPARNGAHSQALEVLNGLRRELGRAGAGMDDMVRAWFYQGSITGQDTCGQRYLEFNRARTDAYRGVPFGRALVRRENGHPLYPASTGIGMQGRGLAASCLALQTSRPEVRVLSLENPGQVPPCQYDARYSPQSPKFSRALAVLCGHFAITWISGTASIVNSESVFPGDIERQTNRTLDNIEQLIAPENFALHGAPRTGAGFADLARVRVYVKRAADYARCRAVCEHRLGRLPVLYVTADVCRPELLVEIEGVAFSPLHPAPNRKT